MNTLQNCPHDIVYVSDDSAGYTRKKRKNGFVYFNSKGKQIKGEKLLRRFASLAIPPAWEDVWICKLQNGHLQATGFDTRSRKQYIYHPLWVSFRQKDKYSKLAQFGRSLPLIRKQAERDLKLSGWPKPKILALMVSLLNEYFMRIGNSIYQEENKTYGLTTLRRKHLQKNREVLCLSYKAKSGKYRNINLENGKLAKLVKKASELPGYEIFRYLDDQNKSQKLDSKDVNDYLYNITNEHFTAKDFRTWGGTVLAIELYPEAISQVESNPKLNLETTIVKMVAKQLGNTTATCKAYYIHPKVLKTLIDKRLYQFENKVIKGLKYKSQMSKSELSALKIISSK